MKRLVVAIPSSHSWFWLQTCVSALTRYPPVAEGVECKIVVVDNSWDWSPAIRGILDTKLGQRVQVVRNEKPRKFHASGLDTIVETFDFDYLMAIETDAIVLRHGWLPWFLNQMSTLDYGVGHWHHEQFLNPSCTLYKGQVLRDMLPWCKKNGETLQRWGSSFEKAKQLRIDAGEDIISLQGPFAETRGWPEGTSLKERPSGLEKGPGWYEPGQALHHWAVQDGWSPVVCPNATTIAPDGMPTQTFYGIEPPAPERNLEVQEMFDGPAYACHFWGGTRALDLLKHPVTDHFINSHMAFWLEREARVWSETVPADVRWPTLKMIREMGWHTKGIADPSGEITERDREAVRIVEGHYRNGGIFL